jgi:uncharacterized membrane protein
MLKRARLWMESGLVMALFGFSGLLQRTAVLFQWACYICALFFVLSLLFSLFEPSESGIPASESELSLNGRWRPARPQPAAFAPNHQTC